MQGILGVAVALGLAGCAADDGNDCPDGPTFLVQDGDRTSMYRGCAVWRAVRDDGTYEPDPHDGHTVVEVPTKYLPPPNADPFTVSLCDAAWDMRVAFHSHCWDTPDPANPVMSQLADDTCVVQGESGQPGIYGAVQLYWRDGHLDVTSAFQADVSYTSQTGSQDGWNYSRGGFLADDQQLEDPILSDPCSCWIGEECAGDLDDV